MNFCRTLTENVFIIIYQLPKWYHFHVLNLLQNNMKNFYRKLVENVTKTAENDRTNLIQYYQKRERNENRTVGYWNDYPPSSNLRDYSWDFPDFCNQYDSNCFGQIRKRTSEIHLIMDYLCIPAWTGVLVCMSIKLLS